MNDLFKGFEQLLELAQTLDEKAKNGELHSAVQTEFQINGRRLSSIPRRTASSPVGVSNVGKSNAQSSHPPNPASPSNADDPAIVPPPGSADFGQTSIGGLGDPIISIPPFVGLDASIAKCSIGFPIAQGV